MDSEHMKATIRMTDGKSQYEARAGGHAPVILDAHAPVGGESGYTPLEILLFSLMSCTGMTLVNLLRERMRRQVTAVEATADGVLRDAHPKGFSSIDVHITLTSPDATEAEVARALASAEEKVCPVWGMLKGNVDIRATVTVVR